MLSPEELAGGLEDEVHGLGAGEGGAFAPPGGEVEFAKVDGGLNSWNERVI